MAKLNVAGGNAIVKDEKFLLVRETKPSVVGQYNLPAGGIEEGETVFECAVREAKEETGLTVNFEHLLGVYQRFKEDGWSIITFVFFQKLLTVKCAPPRSIQKSNSFLMKRYKSSRKKDFCEAHISCLR